MKLLTKKCMVGQCPAIFEDGTSLVIIGSRFTSSVPDKVSVSEEAVKITEALLNEAGFYRIKPEVKE